MVKQSKVERDRARAEAIARLREMLPDGAEVLTVLRHVSASGMSRRITCHVATLDSEGKPDIRTLTHKAAVALGWREHRDFVDSIMVAGCGMDMGFHLVHSLGAAIGRELRQRWI